MNPDPAVTAKPAPTSTWQGDPTPTPFTWRLAIAAAVATLAGGAYMLQPMIGPRGQALAGVLCFFGIVAVFSANLRAVNWHTIVWGVALQVFLAVLVLKVKEVNDGIRAASVVVEQVINFSDKGAKFVFGNMTRRAS